MADKEFDKIFDKQDCYDYSCEARDCCECSTYQEALAEYEQEKARKECRFFDKGNCNKEPFNTPCRTDCARKDELYDGKLKVSVGFQNRFADMLYTNAEQALFKWFGKHNIPAAIWGELINAVNESLYATIKACMDNNGMVVPLFSDIRKSFYFKQYSRKTLQSWTKAELVEQVEILQHNFAAAENANDNQAKYFEECVAAEVQRRLLEAAIGKSDKSE